MSFLTCSNPNPFHPLKDKDYTAAQKEAISAMIKTANDDGIRLKTARETKVVLVNFLAALGHKADVSFEEKALNAALTAETHETIAHDTNWDQAVLAISEMDSSALGDASS